MKVYNLTVTEDSWTFIDEFNKGTNAYFADHETLSNLNFIYLGRQGEDFVFYVLEFNLLDYYSQGEIKNFKFAKEL